MTESKLIDTSVWISYLFNGVYSEIIDKEEILLLSSLSLFEIKKKLLKEKTEKHKIQKIIDFVKKKSLIMSVTPEICEKAADISIEHNLPMTDALIYATGILNHAIIITQDNDFRNLPSVLFLS